MVGLGNADCSYRANMASKSPISWIDVSFHIRIQDACQGNKFRRFERCSDEQCLTIVGCTTGHNDWRLRNITLKLAAASDTTKSRLLYKHSMPWHRSMPKVSGKMVVATMQQERASPARECNRSQQFVSKRGVRHFLSLLRNAFVWTRMEAMLHNDAMNGCDGHGSYFVRAPYCFVVLVPRVWPIRERDHGNRNKACHDDTVACTLAQGSRSNARRSAPRQHGRRGTCRTQQSHSAAYARPSYQSHSIRNHLNGATQDQGLPIQLSMHARVSILP